MLRRAKRLKNEVVAPKEEEEKTILIKISCWAMAKFTFTLRNVIKHN
jgi:hypothetical protein